MATLDQSVHRAFSQNHEMYSSAKDVLFPSNERGLTAVLEHLKKIKKGGTVIGVAGPIDTLITISQAVSAKKVVGYEVNQMAIDFAKIRILLSEQIKNSDEQLDILLPNIQRKEGLVGKLFGQSRREKNNTDSSELIQNLINDVGSDLTVDQIKGILDRGSTHEADVEYFLELYKKKQVWFSSEQGKKYSQSVLNSGSIFFGLKPIQEIDYEEDLSEIIENDDEKISVFYLSNVHLHTGTRQLQEMIHRLKEVATDDAVVIFADPKELTVSSLEDYENKLSF